VIESEPDEAEFAHWYLTGDRSDLLSCGPGPGRAGVVCAHRRVCPRRRADRDQRHDPRRQWADNGPGMGYDEAMGFSDHAVARALPLRDGTPVDQISKRFRLRRNTTEDRQ
jgi:hypothetical protein